MAAPRLRASMASRFLRSSAECDSASLAIRSTSSLDKPEEELMVIFCSFLVARSMAVTLRMPLASISKVTSTCGTPRGAGGIPPSWKTPRSRLPRALARSPWGTWNLAQVWPRSGGLGGGDGGVENVVQHLLEPRACDFHHQVLGSGGVGGDKGQVDLGLKERRKLHLGLFGCFFQPLQRHLIFGQIDALFLTELGDGPVNDALIDIVAAEVRVTVSRFDFHDAFADLEN